MRDGTMPRQRGPHADVAIVGSGPGGAVMGLLLAEAGLDVLILEEGARVPVDAVPALSPEEMRRKVRNKGLTIALGAPKVAYWDGRCVGGGSEVNRGLYHRPSPEVLEGWARDFGIDALTPDGLAPHVEACEAIARVSLLPGPAPLNSQKLADGAAALGWRWMEVPRLFRYAPDWERDAGEKQSMSTTFLPRFEAAGGRILAETRVRRLVQEGGGWRLLLDVGGLDSGGRDTSGAKSAGRDEIRAAAVVVACGAVESAALLRRSGLRRKVGDGLAFHPMIKAAARFAEPVSADTRLDPVHQIKHFDPRFSLGASVSNPATLALAFSDRPEALSLIAEAGPHLAAFYAQTTGGRGSVRTLPGFRDPLVRAKRNPADLADLAEGLRRLCECLFAAGAEEVYPNVAGIPALLSPDDLRHLPETLDPGRVSLSTLHLTGACSMGERPGKGVADSFGRVRDAEGLHVAGAALLPGPTVVNPQGTIMAVAHRNALHFLEGRRTRRAAARTDTPGRSRACRRRRAALARAPFGATDTCDI